MSQVANPANSAVKATEAKTRIPMSLPIQKLAVPDIPGFHLHWMAGNPARISQALKAGYKFVENDEVDLNVAGLADDASKTGNSDLGSRVSVGSGLDERGDESRLYLMKIEEEFWQEDQKLLEARNEQLAATIRGGSPDGAGDTSNRYIPEMARKGVENLFTPKRKPR